MIKKISLFFSAIAIAILGIFGGISLKNTAKPQYFLENTQVKNAAVITTNETQTIIDFYFDNINNYNENTIVLVSTTETQMPINLYYYNLNNELIFDEEYTFSYIDEFIFYSDKARNSFEFTDVGESYYYKNIRDNIWYNYDDEPIKGFRLTFGQYNVEIENLELLNAYIGNLTSLPEEPQEPLEQINTLVSDIVNWFTNIFNGLGNVFYDPTANKLTAWGTVLFIGIAIMLISMALKWVISLIRGV